MDSFFIARSSTSSFRSPFETAPSPNNMDNDAVLQRSLHNKVLTLCFNDPRRKNAWGASLLSSVLSSLTEAASDPNVAVVVLTGRGDYYCSGVDFVSSFPIKPPSALAAHLEVANQKLFDTFLDFPKPLIVAANGPSIGAAVTTASLCDAVLAHPTATFHTPFAVLRYYSWISPNPK